MYLFIYLFKKDYIIDKDYTADLYYLTKPLKIYNLLQYFYFYFFLQSA